MNRRNLLKAAAATGIAGSIAGCSSIVGDSSNSSSGNATKENADLADLPSEQATIASPLPEEKTIGWYRGPLTFKQYMENATNNKFTVKIKGGGALGGHKEILEQERNNTIEMAYGQTEGDLAKIYKDWNVVTYPYLIKSPVVGRWIFDHEFGDGFNERFRKSTGLRILAQWTNGGGIRQFTVGNPHKLRKIDDFKGLSIRTLEIEAHQELVRQLGADPQPISGGELYGSLDQGVVDGEENPYGVIKWLKVYEVQDEVFVDNHLYSCQNFHCNDDWYQNLHPKYKKLVMEGARRAERDARAVNSVLNQQSKQFLKNNGLKLYIPSKNTQKKLEKATQKPVEKKIRDIVSNPSVLDDFLKAHKKARKALGFNSS